MLGRADGLQGTRYSSCLLLCSRLTVDGDPGKWGISGGMWSRETRKTRVVRAITNPTGHDSRGTVCIGLEHKPQPPACKLLK
jgi:hypothetical protein